MNTVFHEKFLDAKIFHAKTNILKAIKYYFLKIKARLEK